MLLDFGESQMKTKLVINSQSHPIITKIAYNLEVEQLLNQLKTRPVV